MTRVGGDFAQLNRVGCSCLWFWLQVRGCGRRNGDVPLGKLSAVHLCFLSNFRLKKRIGAFPQGWFGALAIRLYCPVILMDSAKVFLTYHYLFITSIFLYICSVSMFDFCDGPWLKGFKEFDLHVIWTQTGGFMKQLSRFYPRNLYNIKV